MKRIFIALLGMVGAVMVLSGCGGGYSGSVLGLPDSDRDSGKIVTFSVVGKGLEPENATTRGEAMLMAERAAIADGYRQLVEKIRGVYVEAQMKSGNGSVDYDVIKLHTQSWLRGTEVVEVRRGDSGITAASMRLKVNFAKRGMVWWPMGVGQTIQPGVTASRKG